MAQKTFCDGCGVEAPNSQRVGRTNRENGFVYSWPNLCYWDLCPKCLVRWDAMFTWLTEREPSNDHTEHC